MISPENCHVLLVDDDQIVRETMRIYLEDCGYRITQAESVAEALQCIHSEEIDLVLTDLRMPAESGLVLLDKIRQEDSGMPVVVYSGAGMMGDVVRALRLGASDYLLKPFADMEIVRHSIEKALEQQQLRRQNNHYFQELEAVNKRMKQYIAKLEEDQIAGREVQQQLLPETPLKCGDYQVAHHLLPRLYLSGDFLDVTVILGRYLLFYLVDVSGHGVSSAFATVWLKNAISQMLVKRTHLRTLTGPKPDTNIFLRDINRRLITSQLQHHMTCFHGMLDMEENTLRYSVAGHLPLPVIMNEEGCRFLEGKGKPVGLFAEEEWPVYEVDIPKGSQLLMFSDGILEVLPTQDLLQKESNLLSEMSGKYRQENGPFDLTGVVDWFESMVPDNLDDDIAVLSISREC